MGQFYSVVIVHGTFFLMKSFASFGLTQKMRKKSRLGKLSARRLLRLRRKI
ncbi:hypothetical protein SAMN05443144_12054 [Fodinibius roseus]|uniref:Uncharacterized protein n=1 Tax=Fodinibius roseus TaxID=1194090 RepID=A0A1M5HIJ9_9BACT|nr:hypothetical protein SAMN05443144_12054 [Fodinibius roseus]